jgi:hypothetical protein
MPAKVIEERIDIMGIEVLIPLAGIGMIAFIAWVIVRGFVSRSQHRLEAHSRMLDRFGSSAEFVSFLQTPEGRGYLQGVAQGSHKSQKEKILGSVRTGVILVFLSLGIMVAGFLAGGGADALVIGVFGIFLGAGFLASAAISYRLSKAWSILEEPSQIRG